MRLIRALRDCKQRSLTVSKKAPTVSTKLPPIFIVFGPAPPHIFQHALKNAKTSCLHKPWLPVFFQKGGILVHFASGPNFLNFYVLNFVLKITASPEAPYFIVFRAPFLFVFLPPKRPKFEISTHSLESQIRCPEIVSKDRPTPGANSVGVFWSKRSVFASQFFLGRLGVEELRCPNSRCTVRSGSNRTDSQRFHTGPNFMHPHPPSPENTLLGGGVYKRGGRIKFLPRGASKYTSPPPSPEKCLLARNGGRGGGGGRI